MFDTSFPESGTAVLTEEAYWARELDRLDWPTDSDFAPLDALPTVWDAPRDPVAVVADGEQAAIGPQLIGELAALDPAALDDDATVGLAAAWARVENYAAAQKAAAVAAFAGPAPTDEHDQAAFAWSSIGAALHLGDGASSRLVEAARLLFGNVHEGLPGAVAAMRRGDLSLAKATVLAEATAALTDAQRAAVEVKVLPDAPDRTPAQHSSAVRRAVDRVDPAGAEERKRKARDDIELIRHHYGNGMGELLARLPSEQMDTLWLACDTWARREKATGSRRTLRQLRVDALVHWAVTFLRTGSSLPADQLGDLDAPPPADPDTGECADHVLVASTGELVPDIASSAPTGPPTRHGRPVALHVIWDLTSLLGLTRHCGELADSGASLPPETMRELLAAGVRVRRLLIDPVTGRLIDLSPARWTLGATADGSDQGPVTLDLVVPSALAAHDDELLAAIATADAAIHELLAYPLTADALDARPHVHDPTPALADFVVTRDRHPVTPTAGPTAARAADLDHPRQFEHGGRTVRANQASLGRRWHRGKTFGYWDLTANADGTWTWTDGRTGRTYTTAPHDYRLGP